MSETVCVYDKQFSLPDAIRKAKELNKKWIYRSIDSDWVLDIQDECSNNMVNIDELHNPHCRYMT